MAPIPKNEPRLRGKKKTYRKNLEEKNIPKRKNEFYIEIDSNWVHPIFYHPRQNGTKTNR